MQKQIEMIDLIHMDMGMKLAISPSCPRTRLSGFEDHNRWRRGVILHEMIGDRGTGVPGSDNHNVAFGRKGDCQGHGAAFSKRRGCC